MMTRTFFLLFTLLFGVLVLSCKTTKDLSAIEELDLSGRWLGKIPSRILDYKNLKKINLRNNNFKKFPAELAELKQLRTILLANNRIGALTSDEMGLFENLEILDLDNNKIKKFPNLRKLNNLKIVTIINNELTEVNDLPCKIPRGAVLVHGHEFSVRGSDCNK